MIAEYSVMLSKKDMHVIMRALSSVAELGHDIPDNVYRKTYLRMLDKGVPPSSPQNDAYNGMVIDG